ncbi:hypothetical protein [Polaribacter porphyrae]|uniref:hypothetical protein n=1 Tax=Polaribacter porphyrae TaxID=1137780 RepID=UPI0011B01A52|nr:hypothetical protein [Polaribacter porphyrae]
MVRIIGKPDKYYWGILNVSGEGANGPYWIFVLGLTLAVSLLYSAFRVKARIYSYITILLWHLLVLYLVVMGFLQSKDTTIQGQGLHWEFPIWILVLTALLSIVCIVAWIRLEIKNGIHFKINTWQKQNSKMLIISGFLLFLAIYLFSVGDNYNWITSSAIIVTIIQWIFLVESFKPIL